MGITNKKIIFGVAVDNRSILLSELKRIKKEVNKMESPNPEDKFAYLSINLKCGCTAEYHNEEEIPHNNSKCDCGNYFIIYKDI
jgi:hypothetical protein